MQLNIDNKIVEFTKIVAFGCSYTAGFESRDHVYFGVSDAEMDQWKLKDKTKNAFTFYTQFGLKNHEWNKLCDENKEGSYIKFLADELSVSWENFAEPGSSLEFSIWKLEEYLRNNKNTDELIVIGVTCPNRLMYLITDEREKEELDKTKALHLQLNTSYVWPDQEFYNTFVTTLGTAKNLAWKYFYQLKYLDMLSKKLGNRILLIPMQTQPSNWIDMLDHKSDYIEEIKQLTSIFPDVMNNYSGMLENTTNNYKIHPFLHPRLSVHQEFAKNIHKILMDNSNDK